MTLTDVRVLDSVTQVDGDETGAVLAGSHGGVYACYLAARAGARGVVLHDAGVGKDDAGIAGLPYLDDLGCPGATVAHDSARIADGIDMARRGTISHCNDAARELGCEPGQAALDCVAAMREGPGPTGDVPEYGEGRALVDDGDPPVWCVDSLTLIGPEHEGAIAITASHGARLAGETTSYIAADVAAAVFNDAGVGVDDAGISRLPFLDERSIPGATVAADSARIGDAESAWETGEVSHCNDAARAAGVRPGMDLPTFAERIRASIADRP